MPSLYVEILGILLRMFQWISPIWLAYQSNSFFTWVFLPIFHLLSYVVCQRFLHVFRSEKIENKVDKLYFWHYCRW
jgi:hypothetical protein